MGTCISKAKHGSVARTLRGIDLKPSVQIFRLCSTASVQTESKRIKLSVTTSTPSAPQTPLSQQLAQTSQLSSSDLKTTFTHSWISSSGDLPSLYPHFSSSTPVLTNETPLLSALSGNVTETPVMPSTNVDFKPIPPATTQIGGSNGHHEITEPNFTSTKPCRGCSPVIEIPATGWIENSPVQQQGTTDTYIESILEVPFQKTISAGLSNIVVSQQLTGGNFVIDGSKTLTPGQTITVDGIAIAAQSSQGRIEVIVGATVIRQQPDQIDSQHPQKPQITDPPVPLLPVLTIGTTIITADARSQYVVFDQTLAPGGSAIVIAGTTLSLAPSATALIINGKTASLPPPLDSIYTTTIPVEFTFNNTIYTVNPVGFIVIGQNATLIPGGPAVTVDGTTLSLEHDGTAVVMQGTTRALQPITTVVTLTRAPTSGSITESSTGVGYLYPTEKPVPDSAARSRLTVMDGWLGGLFILMWWGSGLFAFRL